MNLEVTTPPASEPVSVADAKEHVLLSSNFTGDDTYLDSLVRAARRRVERYLGRSLITQTITLELDSDEVTDPLWLPRPPHQSITSVKTYDDDDNETVVTSANYRVVGGNPFRITQIEDGWNLDRRIFAMEVIYVAGYGDADDVPEEAKTAIKMEVMNLYENRGDEEPPRLTMMTQEILHDLRYDYL